MNLRGATALLVDSWGLVLIRHHTCTLFGVHLTMHLMDPNKVHVKTWYPGSPAFI